MCLSHILSGLLLTTGDDEYRVHFGEPSTHLLVGQSGNDQGMSVKESKHNCVLN